MSTEMLGPGPGPDEELAKVILLHERSLFDSLDIALHRDDPSQITEKFITYLAHPAISIADSFYPTRPTRREEWKFQIDRYISAGRDFYEEESDEVAILDTTDDISRQLASLVQTQTILAQYEQPTEADSRLHVATEKLRYLRLAEIYELDDYTQLPSSQVWFTVISKLNAL